jgi:SAM-dependent methyltransferase
MSLDVLQNRGQIKAARQTLKDRNLSATPGPVEYAAKTLLAKSRLARPLILGDYVKSWDVLAMVQFLETHVAKTAPLLDIGAYASEILVSLHKDGFTDLTGVDLNPRIGKMPFADKIKYVTSDFMATPFESGTFDAITATSVIEHGYDGQRLFREASRILRVGGYFLASFDYWTDKIDTGNTRFFDMDWLIFSKDDVEQMLVDAAAHALKPVGKMNYGGSEQAISHGGYNYTFAWIALQKQVS